MEYGYSKDELLALLQGEWMQTPTLLDTEETNAFESGILLYIEGEVATLNRSNGTKSAKLEMKLNNDQTSFLFAIPGIGYKDCEIIEISEGVYRLVIFVKSEDEMIIFKKK